MARGAADFGRNAGVRRGEGARAGGRRGREGGELAGLPEGEGGLQAVDQAVERGQNQGVQDCNQPGAGLVMGRLGSDVGQDGGQLLGHRRGWFQLHGRTLTNLIRRIKRKIAG